MLWGEPGNEARGGAGASQKQDSSFKVYIHVSNCLGKISKENSKTERGTYDEAVVEVQIKPIHSLIHIPLLFLKKALERALLVYMNEEKKKMCKLKFKHL